MMKETIREFSYLPRWLQVGFVGLVLLIFLILWLLIFKPNKTTDIEKATKKVIIDSLILKGIKNEESKIDSHFRANPIGARDSILSSYGIKRVL